MKIYKTLKIDFLLCEAALMHLHSSTLRYFFMADLQLIMTIRIKASILNV
jgi:hypothetical protein